MTAGWNHAARGIGWAVGLHTQRPTDGAARLAASRKALRQFVSRWSVCQERRGAPAAAPRLVRAPSGSGGRGGRGRPRATWRTARDSRRGRRTAPCAAPCRAAPAAAQSGFGAATPAARHWDVRRDGRGAGCRVERQSRVTAAAPPESRGGGGATAVVTAHSRSPHRVFGHPCGRRRRGGRARTPQCGRAGRAGRAVEVAAGTRYGSLVAGRGGSGSGHRAGALGSHPPFFFRLLGRLLDPLALTHSAARWRSTAPRRSLPAARPAWVGRLHRRRAPVLVGLRSYGHRRCARRPDSSSPLLATRARFAGSSKAASGGL